MKGARPAQRVDMDGQEEREQIESIRRGIAEIEAGHYIPHESMKAWLLSLSLNRVSPPPKCVCGQTHDPGDEVQER
jgi:hypothetical protein